MAKPKVIVIVGPTSSGKSELAVKLAKKYNGEIISADSRQVYRGMNIGTGKVAGAWHTRKINGRLKYEYKYKGIIHHGMDFVNPKKYYSVAQFCNLANKAIFDILRQGKLPIICGGTGHWIDALIYNQTIPEVKPNPRLRAELAKRSADELFAQLNKLDPRRAKTIDKQNPRRLIRALEIIQATRQPVPKISARPIYDALWLGLKLPQKTLNAKIKKRLKQRLKQGMLHEVRKLHKQGISWKKLVNFGLEYKFCALFLQKKISQTEMDIQLLTAIKQYAKRQMTWFKRNKQIQWIKNAAKSKTLVQKFLKNFPA